MKTCWFGWHRWFAEECLRPFNGSCHYYLSNPQHANLIEKLISGFGYGDFETAWSVTFPSRTRVSNRVCLDCNKVDLQIEKALPAAVDKAIAKHKADIKNRAKLQAAVKVHRLNQLGKL